MVLIQTVIILHVFVMPFSIKAGEADCEQSSTHFRTSFQQLLYDSGAYYRFIDGIDPGRDELILIEWDSVNISKDLLTRIGKCRHLVTLVLSNCDIDEEAVSAIPMFYPNLEYIDFFGANISDSDLSNLSSIKSLEKLVLNRTQITDKGMRSLKSFKKLSCLSLEGTGVTNSGLQHILGLHDLKELHLSNTSIDDEGVKRISGMAQITSLSLRETRVTNAGLQFINRMKELTFLDLASTRISVEGLQMITGLDKLRHMYLSGNSIPESKYLEIRRLFPKATIFIDSKVLSPDDQGQVSFKPCAMISR